MKMKTSWLHYIVVAATLLFVTTSVHATTITPGESGVLPTDFGTIPSSTQVLDQVNGTFNIAGGAITGSYVEGVAVDPFGITCSGCLDFFFQVGEDDTSTGSITRMGLDGLFPSFSDNVGYATESGGIEVAPTSAAFGTTLPNAPISEFFTINSSAATDTSDIMVIATNATSYAAVGNLGFSYVVNGVAGSNPVIGGMFTPVQTPEPATSCLLAIGLLGLIACISRRKSIA